MTEGLTDYSTKKPGEKFVYRLISKDESYSGFCGRKKGEWYIKKGLATLIDEKTIKLNFVWNIPKDELVALDYEATIDKSSCCNACGSIDKLKLSNIIPHKILKYFPSELCPRSDRLRIVLCDVCISKVSSINVNLYDEFVKEFNLSYYDVYDKELEYIRIIMRRYAGKWSYKFTEEEKNKIVKYFGHFPSGYDVANNVYKYQKFDIYKKIGDCENYYEYIVNEYKKRDDGLKQLKDKCIKFFYDNIYEH